MSIIEKKKKSPLLNNKRWNQEDVEKLVELSKQGYSYRTMGELLNRSDQAVSCKLSEIKTKGKVKANKFEETARLIEKTKLLVEKPNHLIKTVQMLESASASVTIQIVNGKLKMIKFED